VREDMPKELLFSGAATVRIVDSLQGAPRAESIQNLC
jgi:hypothetical protein